MNEDNDILLPEGYKDGDDIFPPGDGEPAQQTADVQDQAAPDAAPTTGQGEADPAPTTEQGAGPEDAAPAQQAAPTTEQPAAAEKLRFTAKVDRSDVDVELDPKDLPSIYQRAQVTDRFQQRLGQLQPRVDRAEQLARTLGYRDLDDMLVKAEERYLDGEVQRLVSEGTPKGMAEFIARQNAREAKAAAAAPPTPAPPPAGSRDFAAELTALKQTFPDAAKGGRLPDEVVEAAAKGGQPLIAAYAAWNARQKAAEADRLRRELEVLRQNQQNTSKAPVTGVAGGGDTDQKPVDDFLRGFGD